MPLKGGSPQVSPIQMGNANMILDLSDCDSNNGFFSEIQAPTKTPMMGGTRDIKVINVSDRGGSYYRPPSSKYSDYDGGEDVSTGDE